MSRIGPIGPTLPPTMRMPNEDEQNSNSDDDGYYGPALPTHLKPQKTSLEELVPSIFSNKRTELDASDESSSDDVVGPLPANHSDVHSCSAVDIDKRSLIMKRKLLGEDNEGNKQPQREDWMIELPELQQKNFGLGPRSFNRTDKPECVGRDQWTSTPTSKATTSKEKDNIESEMRKQYFEKKRNKKLEKIVSEFDKKKRSESLLKVHQKELKSKKDKSSDPKERKPFDRDEDLKLNKLDDAKKKALIKRSQELNSKFKTGNQKFL